MAENGNQKLKIKTVSGASYEEELTFSPEEMQPIEVAEALESDLIMGKTPKQIKKARKMFGANELRNEFSLSFRESLKNQFKGLLGLFLVLSSFAMYLFRHEEKTFLVMSVVVLAMMLLNAFAEYRANIALKLPKKYSSLKAKVIRNGEESVIDSRLLVPGDIIIIEDGMMVPADCRLIDDMNLYVLESHISGANGSIRKDSRYISRDGMEAFCLNTLYAGSIVTSGHGSAIVCRTGKETLMRRIRSGDDEHLPEIMKYVKTLSGYISIVSLIVSFFLLVIGVAAGADITDWFIVSVAIGASSLCDSMISLCSSSLAFGAKKMAEDGMVVKNYSRIQTLAMANTIMCGKNLAFPPKRISLTGLYFSVRNYDREKRPDATAEELAKLMLVCSDARKITAAEKKKTRGLPEYKGSPIDDAIVEYFAEWTKPIGMIRDEYIRLDAEYTLSGDISRMLVLKDGKNMVIVRGSPENILSRCVGYTLDGSDYKLSDFTRKKILLAAEDSARTSSFLVAVACGETEATTLRDIEAEHRLIFKGFISFASSLDAGVASSVYRCEAAGIETVLNSNDAYYTALNSAKSAGIITDEAQIITAEQMRTCSRGLLIANAPYYRMFLNIDDNEWHDIVRLRKEDGRVTAVTAERINELPIMSEADVSIVPDTSCDTLRMTADVMMLGNGINLIADGILNAKTVFRRILSVINYLPIAAIMMLVASVFAVCYNQVPAFRTQDVLFGGIIFNIAFAFTLAFEPRNVKNLRETFPPMQSKPSFNDFIYPLMFAIGGGITLFVCAAATQSPTCTMISISLLLFLYAGSIGGHGGIFASKRFGNRLLYICGAGVLAIIAILMCTKLGHNVFGYGIPTMARLIISLVLSIGYFVLTQIGRYFLSPKGKNAVEDKPQEEVDSSDESDSTEIEEGDEDEDEDEDEDDEDDYDVDEDDEEDYEDQEEEKENINNNNERSNDND